MPVQLKKIVPKKVSLSFAERLAQSRELVSRLADDTDQLNAALLDAQEALAQLGLGVSASVEIESVGIDNTGYSEVTYLSFGKWQKAWRLLIEESMEPPTSEDDCTTTPLIETSRETRLLAAKHLPELAEKLLEAAEKLAKDVQSSTEGVRRFVQDIRNAEVPS